MSEITSTPSVLGGGRRLALGEVSNTVKPQAHTLKNQIEPRHQLPLKPAAETPLPFDAPLHPFLKPTELFPKKRNDPESHADQSEEETTGSSSSGSDSELELPIGNGQKKGIDVQQDFDGLDWNHLPEIEYMHVPNYDRDYYPILPDDADLEMLRKNLKHGEMSDDEIWALKYPKGSCPAYGHNSGHNDDGANDICGCGIILEDLPDDETWFLNSTPVDANVVLSTIDY